MSPSIADYERLLSRHVSTVPNFDKSKYIESYLREQAAHTGAYASQGRVTSSSWSREVLQESQDSMIEERTLVHRCIANYELGTPILKPRKIQSSYKSVQSPQPKETAAHNSNTHKRRNHNRRHKGACSESSVVMVDKASPRKHKRKAFERQKSSDMQDEADEHYQRLKERRDRKRAKMAIVDVPKSTPATKLPKRGRGKADGKARVPAALALMHGFLATNVRKGRITVKPTLNIGVFNRGKASVNTLVTKPCKSGTRDIGFTEDMFLKGTQNATVKRPQVLLSSPPDGSLASNSEESSGSPNQGVLLRSNQRSKGGESDIRSQKASGLRAHNSKGPGGQTVSRVSETVARSEAQAESVVWDIEFDGVSLRSEHIAPLDGQGSQTVLLDNHLLCTVQQPVEQHSRAQEQASLESLGGLPNSPSPSVGPSESVSQFGLLASDPIPGVVQSKYFVLRKSPSPGTFNSVFPSITSRKPANMSGASSCTTLEMASLIRAPSIDTFLNGANEHQEYALLASNCSAFENLPHVDPQDYEYSDHGLCLQPLKDNGCQAQGTANEQGNHTIANDNSFLRWQEYESRSLRDEPYTPSPTVEDQLMDDCNDIDGYCNLSEREEHRCYGSKSVLLHEYNSFSQDLLGSIDGSDNHPVLSSPSSPESSIDGKALTVSPTRFAQGRALLLGYAGGNLWASTNLSHKSQISLSQAEASVVEGLKNHWLPQRL